MQLDELQVKEFSEMVSNKRQIYIVDDDESVCRALKLLLVSREFKVATFNSAEDFFSAVPNSTPGCLILDINMPGLKGWEAQQRLLKSGSKRPVMIISADRMLGLKERALNVGAMGFLQKPFNDEDLIGLINQAFFNYEAVDLSLRESKMDFIKQKKTGVKMNENLKGKGFLVIVTAMFLTVSISGCNMMRGAGKDVENAGGSIQRTVDKND